MMTEQEVEVVAQALAEASGVNWQPERDLEPVLHIIYRRFRDRARLALAALDRHRARQSGRDLSKVGVSAAQFQAGSEVVYCPPYERRGTRCTVERVEEGRAYIVPSSSSYVGWVNLSELNVMPCASNRGERDSLLDSGND
jgi:hypothetical protein